MFFGEKLAILEENNDRYPSNLDTDPDPDPDPGPALEKNESGSGSRNISIGFTIF